MNENEIIEGEVVNAEENSHEPDAHYTVVISTKIPNAESIIVASRKTIEDAVRVQAETVRKFSRDENIVVLSEFLAVSANEVRCINIVDENTVE